jgi:nitronate monooxygenase
MRNTARIFRNSIAEEVMAIEGKGGATIEDIAHLVAGERGRKVLDQGDMEAGIWSAGMVAGLIRDIPSCEELVHRIVSEAADIINKRLAGVASA